MNLIRIKIGLVGIGIIIFGYIFGYILHHTYDTSLFTKPPDVVGIGLCGLGLAIIIGVFMPVLYMIIIHMVDVYEEWKRNTTRNTTRSV